MQGGFFEDFAINSEVISMGRTVTEVEDGSTIQIGIGAVGEAAINFLHEKKDLGIHSEMVPEGLRPLVEVG